MFVTGAAVTMIWGARTDVYTSSDAAPATTLYFNPASTTVATGSSFPMVATVNPGSNALTEVDVVMTYNASLFSLTSIACSNNFPTEIAKVIPTSTTGTATAYMACGNFDTTVTSPASAVATFTFSALSTAVTNSSMAFTEASLAAAVNESNDAISSMTGATVTVTVADTTGPTFTVVDGASATPVKTDTINITVADGTGVASRFYGFSTDSTCNASDTITTAFTSGTNFSITGNHSDYLCVKATDTAPAANVSYQLVGQLHVDNAGPTVTQVTAVSSPTNDTTPNYTFSTTEAGTIQYAGDCSSSTTSATAGSNTITFATLSAGAHSNCTIRVTDVATNQSSALAVNTFTIDTTLPVVTQATAVPTYTNDTTPNYTFSTTKAGTIQYSGDCSSSKTSATAGSNTITFNTLSAAAHSNCTIRVTDTAGNQSTALAVSTFTIDVAAPTGGTLTYADGLNRTHSIAITIGGTIADALSGINTSSRILQRQSATSTSGTCGTYGSWAAITPTGTYPSFTDATVTSGSCYKYRFLVSDNAGNQITPITSTNTVKATYLSDISTDGAVNGLDFQVLRENYFKTDVCGNAADIIADCVVNGLDFNRMRAEYFMSI